MTRRSTLWLAAPVASALTAVSAFAHGAEEPLFEKAVGTATRLEHLATERGRVRVILRLAPSVERDGKVTAAPADAADRLVADHTTTDFARKSWAPRVLSQQRLAAVSVTRAELAALAADPRVARIYEDELSKPTLNSSLPAIGMTEVHAAGGTGKGLIIAILDTGVDRTHAFLAPRVVLEACFSTTVGGDSTSLCPNGQESQTGASAAMACPSNVDGCAHGTHVAGIAAGNRNSGVPRRGVAYQSKILAIQVFSRFSGSAYCGSASPCVLSYTSDQIAALEHVEMLSRSPDYQIAAVNMSLGGGGYTTACDSHPAKPIIDRLRARNIATVIASGNDGYTDKVSAPGCISTAVTVGAVTDGGTLASFTNMGATVDLLAPGVEVTSSVPNAQVAEFNGTSMAAPHVAGAFAALRSKLPWATVDMIEAALKSTGRTVSGRPMIAVASAMDDLIENKPAFTVSSVDAFETTGPMGGSFTPASKLYTLTNTTEDELTWSAVSRAGWAFTRPDHGVLAAGATANVRVLLGPPANNLRSGLFRSTVQFTNVTGGNTTTTREMVLEILQPFCTDRFEQAQVITGAFGRTKGPTTEARRQVSEPLHDGKAGGRSVWCKWVAPETRPTLLSTDESDFDTLLAVYTGSAIGNLRRVSSNDNVGTKVSSRLQFNAVAGRIYYIAIDGKKGANNRLAAGTAVLTWTGR